MHWTVIIQLTFWTIFIIVWVSMLPPKKNSTEYQCRKSYNGALYVTGILSLACFITGFTTIKPVLPFQREVGVGITAIGLLGAIYARLVIGHHWTFNATANTDGTFIDRFPYSLVRHPIYSAQIIMCLGTSLTASNVGVAMFFTIGSYILLLQRAKNEEALLDATSNGAYFVRFTHVGRFFPNLFL